MIVDVFAWLILICLWIFGGAAFFDSNATKYKDVLTGWTLLNIGVICGVGFFTAVVWAIGRIAS